MSQPDTTLDPDYLAALLSEPETPNPLIELIDWSTIHERGDELVDGLVIPARHTAVVAKAKGGKTTFLMHVTVELSECRDPLDGGTCEPATVLYIDGEMGRFDIEERLRELGHNPTDLTRWHASDLPPKLDTLAGGAAVLATAQHLDAKVVVIDGINGTVTGAEKDDTTWRAFYDFTVWPLKRAGIAVLTGDNLGKDDSLGPRGSSVKLDKADAVMHLTRTDNGIKLTTTHRRTAAYAPELLLDIYGIDGDQPLSYRRTESAWPAGTAEAAQLLNKLGIPVGHGRTRVRVLLEQAAADSGDPAQYKIRNNVLAAAIRYRKVEAARHSPSPMQP